MFHWKIFRIQTEELAIFVVKWFTITDLAIEEQRHTRANHLFFPPILTVEVCLSLYLSVFLHLWKQQNFYDLPHPDKAKPSSIGGSQIHKEASVEIQVDMSCKELKKLVSPALQVTGQTIVVSAGSCNWRNLSTQPPRPRLIAIPHHRALRSTIFHVLVPEESSLSCRMHQFR